MQNVGRSQGDVDLYVAVDRAPTLDDYDHRPYLNGSAESVTLRLDEPSRVMLMVHGYDYSSASQNSYLLSAQPAE